MDLDFQHLLPTDFSAQSRVWIYQSSRLFSISEALHIEEQVTSFCARWLSHGDDVRAYGNLFFGQFVLLMTDERTGVSGCSTDSSVRFIKQLGQQFGVDFFNRTNLAFFVGEKVQTLPLNQLQYAIENGFITPETLYFNNTVTTKQELEKSWIIPVKASWLQSKLARSV